MNEKDTIQMLKRNAIYNTFDYTKHHNIMKQMYCDMKIRLKQL